MPTPVTTAQACRGGGRARVAALAGGGRPSPRKLCARVTARGGPRRLGVRHPAGPPDPQLAAARARIAQAKNLGPPTTGCSGAQASGGRRAVWQYKHAAPERTKGGGIRCAASSAASSGDARSSARGQRKRRCTMPGAGAPGASEPTRGRLGVRHSAMWLRANPKGAQGAVCIVCCTVVHTIIQAWSPCPSTRWLGEGSRSRLARVRK